MYKFKGVDGKLLCSSYHLHLINCFKLGFALWFDLVFAGIYVV